MNSKVSFFSALAGSCSGIAVFHRLRFNSCLRTLSHMFLMGLFCALLITWGEVNHQKGLQQAAVKVFESVFGKKVLNSAAGLIPEKSPEKERFLLLPNEGRLWYLPSGKMTAPLTELEKCNFLILWAPKGFATAVRSDSGKWLVNIASPGDDRVLLSNRHNLSNGGLSDLKLVSDKKWNLDAVESISAEQLGKTLSSIWTISLFMQNLGLTLLLPLLYSALFVGVFRFSSGGRYPVRLTYLEFWKIGIYAGFPAMLVASAFPALALPFFSFSTVYMAGLLIYWLYAAGRLERELAVEESDNANEQ